MKFNTLNTCKFCNHVHRQLTVNLNFVDGKFIYHLQCDRCNKLYKSISHRTFLTISGISEAMSSTIHPPIIDWYENLTSTVRTVLQRTFGRYDMPNRETEFFKALKEVYDETYEDSMEFEDHYVRLLDVWLSKYYEG